MQGDYPKKNSINKLNCRMVRHLYLSFVEAQEAIQDKERFDALCFAMLIKANFANSCLYKRSYRQLKDFFHIGVEKLRKVAKNAKKWGYIHEEGDGRIVSHTLKAKGRRNIIIQVTNMEVITNDKDEKKSQSTMTIKGVEHAIRKQMLLAHIENVNHFGNLTKKMSERDNPKSKISRKDYEASKKVASKIVDQKSGLSLYDRICNGDVLVTRVGVSKKALSKAIGRSKFVVREYVKQLHENGSIAKIEQVFESTNIPTKEWSFVVENNDPRESKGFYITVEESDTLVFQCSNIYELKENVKIIVKG